MCLFKKKRNQLLKLTHQIEQELLNVKTAEDFCKAARRFNILYKFYIEKCSRIQNYKTDNLFDYLSNNIFDNAMKVGGDYAIHNYIKECLEYISNISYKNMEDRHIAYKKLLVDKEAGFHYDKNVKIVDLMNSLEIITTSTLLNYKG